jgi:TolB protein
MRSALYGAGFVIASACGGDTLEPPDDGALIFVSARTTGVDPDSNGYTLLVNPDGPDTDAGPAEFGISASISTIVAEGPAVIGIGHVADNCHVAGGNLRQLVMVGGTTVELAFEVECLATGTISLAVATSGSDPDLDGYLVKVGSALHRVGVAGTFEIAPVAPGQRPILLTDLAGNCTPVVGTATVTVASSSAIPAQLSAACVQVTRRAIAFSSGPAEQRISVRHADGSIEQLTSGPGSDLSPAWSPDGNRIAFVRHDGVAAALYIMDRDGANQRVLLAPLQGASDPVWSPDGTRIAISADPCCESGPAAVFVVPVDGGPVVTLGVDPIEFSPPSWSPDGTRIAFADVRGGTHQVYLADPAGGEPVQLTTGLGAQFPRWSPDGTRIMYTAACEGSGCTTLRWIEPAGGASAQITDIRPAGSPRWSPDGQRVAFSANAKLWVVNVDGTGLTEISDRHTSGMVAWAPDGSQILSQSEVDCRPMIVLFDASGSQGIPLRIGEAPCEAPPPLWRFSWGPVA